MIILMMYRCLINTQHHQALNHQQINGYIIILKTMEKQNEVIESTIMQGPELDDNYLEDDLFQTFKIFISSSLDNFSVDNGEFNFFLGNQESIITNDSLNNSAQISQDEPRNESSIRRNDQNSNRCILRKLEKPINKFSRKPYKIHQYGKQDRRQILALLRFCNTNKHEIFIEIQNHLSEIYKLQIKQLQTGIPNKHKLFKTICLAKFIIELDSQTLCDQRLEETLKQLFNCGQVKKHKISKKFGLTKYLEYEGLIFQRLSS